MLFFSVPTAIFLAYALYKPATCFDGILNQGETNIDRGGPCKLLDERRLIPHSILWARTFLARPGVHSAIAYIENPNTEAGVKAAPYRMKIYDERNIIVAERIGVVSVMPGTITPVFEGTIDSGERFATRAFFEFSAPLVWERLHDRSRSVAVSDKIIRDAETSPRVSAILNNTDVVDLKDVRVTAVVFDTAGNAFAASSTEIPILAPNEKTTVTFTWPTGFKRRVSRIDVLPIVSPID